MNALETSEKEWKEQECALFEVFIFHFQREILLLLCLNAHQLARTFILILLFHKHETLYYNLNSITE